MAPNSTDHKNMHDNDPNSHLMRRKESKGKFIS